MSRFIITGGKRLQGEITASGSKNSALALIPAALLASSSTVLTNVPVIGDVEIMAKLLEGLGGRVQGIGTNTLTIDPIGLSSYELDPDLSSRVRASVIFAAPLLARFGKAIITPPGGDQIGERLLDTHFSLMQKLGVVIKPVDGKYELVWKKKKGGTVFLEEASVTATEMGLIMASCLKEEVTIDDAACEPHVEDLTLFLAKMGAKIRGQGSNRIYVNGKPNLVGVDHKVVSDHIDAGTFAIAAAITGGEVEIKDCPGKNYRMILDYFKEMGVEAEITKDERMIIKKSVLSAQKRKFQTRPWPGFPTDLMSPFIVLATQTKGTVLCHDWMYEWRVFFVDDLIGMGANIFIADPHRVIVTGPTQLHSDKLFCKDIRAGMSVLLAALAAKGESEIENIETIERGYEKIEERFKALGAEIKRISSNVKNP